MQVLTSFSTFKREALLIFIGTWIAVIKAEALFCRCHENISNVFALEDVPVIKLGKPSIPSECITYNTLNDSSRYWGTRGNNKCDQHLVSGHWYRFMGAAGVMMATYCIPQQSCDSYISGWISGHHPNNAFEKVSGSACMHYGLDCCYYSYNIEIRNCSGYYVYALPSTTQQCNARYCGVNGT
ncbi:hypothetical protein pdam_00014188 [Pocillopora damicornis]|uniref:UMOD/GP2/OIT3-like D8C domain-containing protein n=1 Tax=Pocillopora damicornis TaxID=46731 RepID=A0A3M6V531_POCDA|nr:hypothetical protein pdam_00014188 [Pocillopora damicornis]